MRRLGLIFTLFCLLLAAATAYADAHPEILVPLGGDYHGAQSHRYQPANVCPFR
jgi:hypothetical protein